jgi:hypothetical protein
MEALTARHLEQVEDHVAVAQRPPKHGDRPEVEGRGPEPEQVARDPVELHVRDAQVLRASRHLLVEQALDRRAEGVRVEVIGQVVHPLNERDHLPVLLVLAALLDARVDVADERGDVAHDLALERAQEAQHPVRGGVVGPHVDREELGVGLDVRTRERRLHTLERHRLLAPAVRRRQAGATHTSAGPGAR